VSSVVSTGNCKLGHDCRRVCSHRRRDKRRDSFVASAECSHHRRDSTVSFRRRRQCVLGFTDMSLAMLVGSLCYFVIYCGLRIQASHTSTISCSSRSALSLVQRVNWVPPLSQHLKTDCFLHSRPFSSKMFKVSFNICPFLLSSCLLILNTQT